VKIRDHLPHASHSSRHGTNQVMLVAIIDPHVRVSWPDEHSIDSTVSFFKII
jgi:hypothetical protein